MLKSYDARLKEEKSRRDSAMDRVKTCADKCKCTVTDKAEELKAEYQPEKLIRENPWAAALGALGIGAATATAVRLFMFPAKRDVRYIEPPPQKVIVEVAGGNVSARAAQPRSEPSSSFLTSAAAFLGHLPMIIEKAQKLFVEVNGAKKEESRVLGPSGAPIREEMAAQSAPGEFKKTMSRRMAPPPSES